MVQIWYAINNNNNNTCENQNTLNQFHFKDAYFECDPYNNNIKQLHFKDAYFILNFNFKKYLNPLQNTKHVNLHSLNMLVYGNNCGP